jgi:hypothetical protein
LRRHARAHLQAAGQMNSLSARQYSQWLQFAVCLCYLALLYLRA